MDIRHAMTDGAASMAAAIRDIRPDTELSAATPCADFDLASLVNHALGTTAALARVADKQPLDPDDAWGGKTDAAGRPDWPQRLADQLIATAAAWDDESAWQGSVDLGGAEQPASMIGEMAFVEVMMHGWDVASAAGAAPDVPDAVGDELLTAVTSSAELGRRMKAYGPEVDVPDSASSFERALAVAGRDPRWTAIG
jgi:uncharacterized protein (TIGR03086 family)